MLPVRPSTEIDAYNSELLTCKATDVEGDSGRDVPRTRFLRCSYTSYASTYPPRLRSRPFRRSGVGIAWILARLGPLNVGDPLEVIPAASTPKNVIGFSQPAVETFQVVPTW